MFPIRLNYKRFIIQPSKLTASSSDAVNILSSLYKETQIFFCHKILFILTINNVFDMISINIYQLISYQTYRQ